MNRKKVVNSMLIVLAVLLLAGMVVQFTPVVGSLGNLFNRGTKGTPALVVNGTTVTAEELDGLKRNNAILNSADTGVLADDFKTVTVASMIQQTLLKNAVKDVAVSRADVNAEVDKIRTGNNLKDNKAWVDFLQARGLTDSGARELIRTGLAQDRKFEELRKSAPKATDAEAQQYYALNKEKFQSDARVVGRQIVLDKEAKAKEVLAQARSGADFAKLATENSTDAATKGRGGALGPLENGAPRPVAQVALPTVVGAAAFSMLTGGITDVIPDAGKFYIVKVEKYLPPAPKPFADAKTDVLSAVNQQKQNAALESWIQGLKKDVKVEYKDANWKVEDPSVASVAGQNIAYSEVLQQVVSNQQFGALLQQVPAEQAAQLVNSILKPQVVQQLIESNAAPTIAQKLKLNFAGTRADIASALSAYGARDVKVTDADLEKYYTQNKSQFETPATATVDEVSFKDKNQALAFRTDWDGKGNFTLAASKAGGTVSEHGPVTSGDSKLSQELNAAVFSAKTLKAAGEGSLTDVVKVGERYAVLYVKDLKPAETKPLSAVRAQIEGQVLATKKQEAGQLFLAQQVAALKPTNTLDKVLKAQEQRVAAAAPKSETPASGSTSGSAPGSSASGSTSGSTTPATGSTPAEKAPADK